jgi:uncharacterized membrane protein
MATARAIQTEILHDIEQQREQAIAEMAALDAAQDEAAAEEEDQAVFSLDDLPAQQADNTMDVDNSEVTADDEKTILEFTDEDFQRAEDDDAYMSVGEYEEKPKVCMHEL